MNPSIASAKDKPLFTPGPLTTSSTVKQAMLRDLGSRDHAFIDIVHQVRKRLVALGGDDSEAYEAIIIQGSGTFSLEAVLSSTVPPNGRLLVIINGAYGHRIAHIAEVHKIPTTRLIFPENTIPDVDQIADTLAEDASITNVAIVHCETTTGIINPVEQIGALVRDAGRRYFVDAMSSFGAVPLDLARAGVDYLVSSANKCIEGVPGFAFAISRREALLETEGWARTVSLDLFAQWKGLQADGQFRFTPPTHALLAFHQALLELEAEGGIGARGARYRSNWETLVTGMRALGFQEYLRMQDQGFIITSFHYPEYPKFDFEEFYQCLNNKGYVIYPGKVSDADCFRIGSIGRLFPSDMQALLRAIRETLEQLEVEM